MDPFTSTRRPGREDLSIMLDVPMVLEAEMGRSNKTVNDVLKLGEGSVVDFEREAAEPVDLLINGSLVARGEVVEIEGYYGVRITEICRAGGG